MIIISIVILTIIIITAYVYVANSVLSDLRINKQKNEIFEKYSDRVLSENHNTLELYLNAITQNSNRRIFELLTLQRSRTLYINKSLCKDVTLPKLKCNFEFDAILQKAKFKSYADFPITGSNTKHNELRDILDEIDKTSFRINKVGLNPVQNRSKSNTFSYATDFTKKKYPSNKGIERVLN